MENSHAGDEHDKALEMRNGEDGAVGDSEISRVEINGEDGARGDSEAIRR